MGSQLLVLLVAAAAVAAAAAAIIIVIIINLRFLLFRRNKILFNVSIKVHAVLAVDALWHHKRQHDIIVFR